jgi:hypothetical protein
LGGEEKVVRKSMGSGVGNGRYFGGKNDRRMMTLDTREKHQNKRLEGVLQRENV